MTPLLKVRGLGSVSVLLMAALVVMPAAATGPKGVATNPRIPGDMVVPSTTPLAAEPLTVTTVRTFEAVSKAQFVQLAALGSAGRDPAKPDPLSGIPDDVQGTLVWTKVTFFGDSGSSKGSNPVALSRSSHPVQPLASLQTWTWCFPIGWWGQWVCQTWFHLSFTEYETQGFIRALFLGAAIAGAIVYACPPCAPIAGPIAAGLAVSASAVAFIDWLGGNDGIYIEGYYWSYAWIGYN